MVWWKFPELKTVGCKWQTARYVLLVTQTVSILTSNAHSVNESKAYRNTGSLYLPYLPWSLGPEKCRKQSETEANLSVSKLDWHALFWPEVVVMAVPQLRFSATCKTKRARLASHASTTWSKHIKGSKECLFMRTQTHTLHIFRVIPFVKLQNNT